MESVSKANANAKMASKALIARLRFAPTIALTTEFAVEARFINALVTMDSQEKTAAQGSVLMTVNIILCLIIFYSPFLIIILKFDLKIFR